MRQLATAQVVLLLALCITAALAESDHGIVNAHVPEPGVLFGGQPTAEQLQALADAGYETVIDLRGSDEDRGYEEARIAEQTGLEYVPIPVTPDTLSVPETFEEFIRRFREADRPLLVHCASGNRVGALYYAYLVAAEGLSREEALEEARRNGLRSDALVEAVNGYLDR